MSHVTSGPLAACDSRLVLEEACSRAVKEIEGLEFDATARQYKWYGRWMNDWKVPEAAMHSMDPSTFGTADYVIRLKPTDGERILYSRNPDGRPYEIGVVVSEDGTTFRLVWDSWSSGLGTGLIKELCGGDTLAHLQSVIEKHVGTVKRDMTIAVLQMSSGDIGMRVAGVEEIRKGEMTRRVELVPTASKIAQATGGLR